MIYPPQPGVYWFLNRHKKVIYVGKAKNLRQRLKSYTLINQSSPKTQLMLRERKAVKFKITGSEFEALLLEAELIKTYQPKFNILLKDDKSRLYLTFTKELYPKILFTRRRGDFGPYPSALKTRYVLKTLRKIFPFCDKPCSSKPCFYFHLQLCPGACCGKISALDYQRQLKHLQLFLQGKKSKLIRSLKTNLRRAIATGSFEQAAVWRDQIRSLSEFTAQKSLPETELPVLSQDKINERVIALRRILRQYFSLPAEYPLTRIEAYDISNLQGTSATGAMAVFINGEKSPGDYRHFKIKSCLSPDDPKMLAEVISRRVNHSEWGIPNLILIDGGKIQVKACRQVILWDIPVIGLIKNPDRLVLQGSTLKLNFNQPGFKLLQALRDEAHRFSRRLHFALRSRSMSLA
jgi:excinuclease ABC subunit C